LILGCIIEGFPKGLARTLLGFAATILGLFLRAVVLRDGGRVHLKGMVGQRGDRQPDRFPVDFCGIVALGGLVGWLIHKLLKMAHLGWLNRLLGGAFGFLRGVLNRRG